MATKHITIGGKEVKLSYHVEYGNPERIVVDSIKDLEDVEVEFFNEEATLLEKEIETLYHEEGLFRTTQKESELSGTGMTDGNTVDPTHDHNEKKSTDGSIESSDSL